MEGSGWIFIPGESSRIIYKNDALKGVAQQFAADYQTMFGRHLEVAQGKPQKGDFVLAYGKIKTGNGRIRNQCNGCGENIGS